MLNSSPFCSFKSTLHNCVYFWDANKQQWAKAILLPAYLGGTASTLKELKAELILSGCSAVLGHTNIGAPNGAPMA